MNKRKNHPAAAPEDELLPASAKPRVTLTTNQGGLTVIGPAAAEQPAAITEESEHAQDA
jgi:hypothetical protein